MKKLLIGAVALAALGAGVTANAAEIAVPRRAAYVAPVMYTNWTGCHIGGDVGTLGGNDAGYSSGNVIAWTSPAVVFTTPTGVPLTTSFNMTGAIGGAYAGCDYQVGAWVFGIEGDWSVNNKSGSANVLPNLPGTLGFLNSFPGSDVFEAQERWVATLRGRLGYAVDKWLFFVSGGAAWTKVDTSFFSAPQAPSAFANQSDRLTGWTVGAGLEYAVGWGWSVRSEYLYIQFPSYTTLTNPQFEALSSNPPTSTGVPLNVTNGKITNNIFRFGLTYKFGDWGKAPVVTK